MTFGIGGINIVHLVCAKECIRTQKYHRQKSASGHNGVPVLEFQSLTSFLKCNVSMKKYILLNMRMI